MVSGVFLLAQGYGNQNHILIFAIVLKAKKQFMLKKFILLKYYLDLITFKIIFCQKLRLVKSTC